jgi:hypothetical protein
MIRSLANTFALVIGIADYLYINPLPSTVRKDAQDVFELLGDPAFGGYQHTKLLLDGDATRQAILDGLDRLSRSCDNESTVFIYVSSHGVRITSGPYAGECPLIITNAYITRNERPFRL